MIFSAFQFSAVSFTPSYSRNPSVLARVRRFQCTALTTRKVPVIVAGKLHSEDSQCTADGRLLVDARVIDSSILCARGVSVADDVSLDDREFAFESCSGLSSSRAFPENEATSTPASDDGKHTYTHTRALARARSTENRAV